jgi:hypothetical protein
MPTSGNADSSTGPPPHSRTVFDLTLHFNDLVTLSLGVEGGPVPKYAPLPIFFSYNYLLVILVSLYTYVRT